MGWIAIFLAMTFATFKYFPGMEVPRELWNVALFLFLLGPYALWKLRNGFRFTSLELYVIVILTTIPAISAFAAHQEFGQPILYGVLAKRNLVLCGGALALLYLLRRGKVGVGEIEKSLLLLVWATLLLYLSIDLIFDPADFADEYKSFANSESKWEKAAFKFAPEFIIFGFFYYGFLAFRERRNKYYLYAFVLLFYLLMTGQRTMLLSVILSFLILIYRFGSLPRLVVYVPALLMGFVACLSLYYIYDPDQFIFLLEKFQDAFTVLLTGEESNDVSANARISEFQLARPYAEKHWFLGNGDISNQWEGGYEGILGEYFHPSDIGWIGVVYLYGIVGFMLFVVQFLFAIRYARQIKHGKYGKLVDAIQGFLLYYFIISMVTGHFVHFPQVSLMFIALLCHIRYEPSECLRRMWMIS